MDLNNLRLFVCVVQSGSLSAASEKLGMPLATVSRRLGELEASLNTQLLHRSKKGVQPTMPGQHLYEQVYLSIDQLAQAGNRFAAQDKLSGTLRISAFSATYRPLLDSIARFAERYPEVQVHCLMTDRRVDLIADGIDIAVRFGELHTDQVIARKLGEAGTKIVAHPELLARLGTPQRIEDLADFPCTVWAQSEQRAHHWQFTGRAVKVRAVFTSNDSFALADFARRGMALAMLTDHFADGLIAA